MRTPDDRNPVATRRGKSSSYDEWTRQDLLQLAHQLDISSRSSMTRPQLADALRNCAAP